MKPDDVPTREQVVELVEDYADCVADHRAREVETDAFVLNAKAELDDAITALSDALEASRKNIDAASSAGKT